MLEKTFNELFGLFLATDNGLAVILVITFGVVITACIIDLLINRLIV